MRGAAAALVATAVLLGACSPHPRTAQDFKDDASRPVDSAQSITQTLDLTLTEVAKGKITEHLATATLADAADDLDKELKLVQGYDAKGADTLKAKVVAAIQQAADVSHQVQGGATRDRAQQVEPAAKAAADGFDDVANQLPSPDKSV